MQFYVLLFFWNTETSSHFQIVYEQSVNWDFVLYFGDEI
jgi:hypothetical protein